MALAASGLLVLSAVTGKAVPYWDIDIFLEKVSSSKNPVSDTFDITKGVLGGYNPATQMLIGAELWFAISDDLDPRRSEWVRIDLETGLGLQSFLNPSELDFGPFVNGQVSGDAFSNSRCHRDAQIFPHSDQRSFLVLGAKIRAEAVPRVPNSSTTLTLLGVAFGSDRIAPAQDEQEGPSARNSVTTEHFVRRSRNCERAKCTRTRPFCCSGREKGLNMTRQQPNQ